MTKPFVSVLIDTYNHKRFIEEAIVSVLEQDFPALEREIIVVDDASTDGTPEIVRKFEPRLRLIRKPNGGQASAFNVGIPQCKGEIVSFLDGDDWWTRNKLTRVAQAMADDPLAGIVGHGIVSVQQDGREQVESLREGFQFKADTLEGARLLRRRGAFLGTSRMTIRADLLRRIGAVPEEIEIQADEYLFTLAAVLTGAHILPDTLTYYRLHDANNFQLASYDLERLRRKQKSLAALARSLSRRLGEFNVEPDVLRAVVEFAQVSADQLRLMTAGGWPWETVGTEWRMYRLLHPDARRSHRVFKLATLLGALLATPRMYYAAQRKLAQNGAYLRIRNRWLPVPEMHHIKKVWR